MSTAIRLLHHEKQKKGYPPPSESRDLITPPGWLGRPVETVILYTIFHLERRSDSRQSVEDIQHGDFFFTKVSCTCCVACEPALGVAALTNSVDSRNSFPLESAVGPTYQTIYRLGLVYIISPRLLVRFGGRCPRRQPSSCARQCFTLHAPPAEQIVDSVHSTKQ